MKVIVTRDQFISAHLNFVNRKSDEINTSIENELFFNINTLFVFDIKHVEIEFVDFSYLAPYWPKKKN